MPGKRRSMADLLAGQTTVEDPLAGDARPGTEASEAAILVRLDPARIAPTPLNSRSNFGSPDEMTDLGESMRVRQLQPVVIVRRAAYLRLWPEHETNIGDADYVLANGERRWRAATHVSLSAIDALIRPQLADSRPEFLDAIFTENIDRKNLDPIEEARAVEEMVTECGSATLAAERFRRHESWVSQRRALLKLTPPLQGHVRSGELPVRIARTIAALPAAEQEAAWKAAREAEAGKREVRRQTRGQDGRGGAAAKQRPEVPEDFTAVKNPGAVMRWDDLGSVAGVIRDALGPDDRRQLGAMLLADLPIFTAVKVRDR